MSENKMTLEEALKEIEILKLRNRKLAEAFDSQNEKYEMIEKELDLMKACHNKRCAEFNTLCHEYVKLQVKNEWLAEKVKKVLLDINPVEGMKSMCDIEDQRMQAVKSFAEKLKRKLYTLDGGEAGAYITESDIQELQKGLCKRTNR